MPIINNRFVCVADKENVQLAAVVSSYFSEPDTYFPVFIFPNVIAFDEDSDDFNADNYISKIIGNEAAVLVNNALARVGGCEYLILAGISEHQKSYIRFPKSMKVIEIAGVSEVKEKLAAIGITRKDELRCKPSEILKGLYLAKRDGKSLLIDDGADDLPLIENHKGGIVVVEQEEDDVATIVAVNYACSVGANIKIVRPLEKHEGRTIQKFIQKWKEDGSHNQFQKVLNKISQRVGDIDFAAFEYATFFTEGLPYSLGIENIIPCSYVNLSLRADFFVFNCLAFEHIERFNSVVIFSLEEFFVDGETKWLIDFFKKNNYFIRGLISETAKVRDLDYNAPNFPYDILHISSHGGEVDGYAVSEEFTDREGKKHLVEYDEVVGFSPVPGKDLIELHRKTIFRKFDGFEWMSPELAKQNLPHYVFEDMRKSLYQKEELGKGIKREPKDRVPMSCAIKCSDSIHQGMFRTLASHSSPFVFNNTCWSWSEVATFFLAGGARGYIGTLWAIQNRVAITGAQTFYENVLGSTILEAFHKSLKAIENTADKNIYIFWGLHFSTLSKGESYEDSRSRVFRELVRSLFTWIGHVQKTKSKEVKKNSVEIVKLLHKDIINNFKPQDMEKLEAEIEEKVKGMMTQTRSNETEEVQETPVEALRTMEHPPEYRSAK